MKGLVIYMEIRRADLNDLDALLVNRMEFIDTMRNEEVVISDEFIKDTYEYMKKHIKDESMVIWIALDSDKIVSAAMICYYQMLPTVSNLTGNTGYLQNVYTLPNYRGRGLASELVKKIMQDAKDRNVGRLLLHASEMGRPVYEKLGFEDVTKEMIYTIS